MASSQQQQAVELTVIVTNQVYYFNKLVYLLECVCEREKERVVPLGERAELSILKMDMPQMSHSMNFYIFFVRHGETTANRDDILV